MAHITYTDIDDGATRSVAAFNTFLASYQTQSTAITGPNFAIEGLDGRSIQSGSATDGRRSVEYDGGTAGPYASMGAYSTLSIGGGPTTFSSTNGGVGWTVGEGIGILRVRFQTSFFYTYTASPQTSEELNIFLDYQQDGGAFAAASQVFTFQSRDLVAYLTYTGYYRDNLKFGVAVPYTEDGLSHTINELRIRFQTSGATGFSFINTTMQIVRFVGAGVY